MTPLTTVDTYEEKKVRIFDPIELEEGDYFSKVTYQNEPFTVNVGPCRVVSNRLFLSNKTSLEWFERFYLEMISQFHEVSQDWFEDPLSLRELESSFLSPLKANIKDDCFEVLCKVGEGSDRGVPVFHIKGIQFNSKHFFLDIVAEFPEPSEELNEYVVETDELPVSDVHLDKLSIYKVEFLNQRIKTSMSEEIRRILTDKKIKSSLDFLEVFDDEDP